MPDDDRLLAQAMRRLLSVSTPVWLGGDQAKFNEVIVPFLRDEAAAVELAAQGDRPSST